MTITDAIRESAKTGESFSRNGSGWVRYGADWNYKLSAEEVMADDWEPLAQYIERLTGGKRTAAKEQP